MPLLQSLYKSSYNLQLSMEEIIEVINDLISDEEDQNDIINIVEAPRHPRIFRERPDHINIWSEKEFLDRFRLSKKSVMQLLELIEEELRRPTTQNHALSPLTQILVLLRFYATGSMLIVAGDFGGIHKSTTSALIKNCSQSIARLAPQYIKMPRTEEESNKTKLEFYKIARFPNLIGAIDCTHVRILSPGGVNAENFRNRKGFFSLNVQTVSNAKLKICNVVARWPGASHDMTIFSNSRLKAEFEQGIYGNGVLVGDSGYAQTEYMMTPLENPRSRAEELYNESQARSRNVVERQYGVWKRRFPILRNTISVNLETTMNIIVASAVLHNIAVDNQDEVPDDSENEDNEINFFNEHYNPQGNGVRVRQNLINEYFQNLV